MSNLLEKIASPADLKGLSSAELVLLAEELRESIIENVSKTGGHFASNLGAVDMIVALNAVFDPPGDKIVYDVGHQCYAHKMLTGRLGRFPTLRKHGGLSGFLRRDESPYDVFGAGHASTSISAAFGFAAARDVVGGSGSAIAVIGDAGLTGGLALEGLNNAGHSGRDFVVVLNDNEMSIARSVGALARHLSRVRTTGWYQGLERRTRDTLRRLPAGEVASRAAGGVLKHSLTNLVSPEATGVVFEQMGFEYIGPLDGHDLPGLLDVFRNVKQMRGPVLVHLLTVKGKGYDRAEGNARKFHAVVPFEIETGEALKTSSAATYTSVFAQTLVELAEADKRVVGITAAMPDGTGLSKLHDRFPERYFDTGIAEQHAVCFAAGMAASGLRPIVAVYSTFLQRAYDIIVHDVALQNLPVIFALDRAGLVGDDGATHHGTLDISYLRSIPNMVCMAPKDGAELESMLRFAHSHTDSPAAGPIAVRYPRGPAASPDWGRESPPIALGRAESLAEGGEAAIIAIGSMVDPSLRAARELAGEGIGVAVLNGRFIKPLDEAAILQLASSTRRLVIVEENVRQGGFGSAILEMLAENGVTDVLVRCLGLPDRFVEHGTQDILRSECGLTVAAIAAAVRALVGQQAGWGDPMTVHTLMTSR